jgi:hypothetical protein
MIVTRLTGRFFTNEFQAAWTDRLIVAACAVACAAIYVVAYRCQPVVPHMNGGVGWWNWFDQGRYFAAATAWSQGNLDPAAHWYLPGYPLMGAPFVKPLSVHAYFVPDMVCLLVSLWLFARLASHLAMQLPHAPAIGALLFTSVTMLSSYGREIWVVPWSTTGATPFVYACLLGAMRFIAAPRRSGSTFLVGLTGTLVAAFRPTDVLPLVLACGFGMGTALLARWPGWRRTGSAALAAGSGGGLAVVALLAAYLSIYGLHRSTYIIGSESIGFDFGLVPLHWVTLMLDPRSLLDNGQGLLEAFPWMAGGFAGFAVFPLLRLPRSDRLQHATIVLAVSLHIIFYLAYRDLHPDGLFRFENYHYFRWTYPVFALYGVMLLYILVTGAGHRLPVLALALACLAVLLPWRADLRVVSSVGAPAVVNADQSVAFESGLTSVRDGLLVAASGNWGAIYFGGHSLTIAGHRYATVYFREFPVPGGFLLAPLRPLPAGPAQLVEDPRVTPDATVAPLYVRQDLRVGLPCWLPAILHACSPDVLITPPYFPSDGVLPFDSREQRFLAGDWSESEGRGRWTAGHRADIRFRLNDPSSASLLEIEADAYVFPGAAPVEVRVLVNGETALTQNFAQGDRELLRVPLPSGRLKPAPATNLVTLQIANPRAPHDYERASTDSRPLGLFVRALRLVPPAPDRLSR